MKYGSGEGNVPYAASVVYMEPGSVIDHQMISANGKSINAQLEAQFHVHDLLTLYSCELNTSTGRGTLDSAYRVRYSPHRIVRYRLGPIENIDEYDKAKLYVVLQRYHALFGGDALEIIPATYDVND